MYLSCKRRKGGVGFNMSKRRIAKGDPLAMLHRLARYYGIFQEIFALKVMMHMCINVKERVKLLDHFSFFFFESKWLYEYNIR